ncbi:MAG: bifunctional homocysteine S-methyltransferase/methylenetetrahydrofolate reductase [Gemmatimonadetes bacterium]|nr:bifunctional homocysteine S-methyltransferase/methylenetetrahydrofolate reductase [Gemmatimonadota bacterium]
MKIPFRERLLQGPVLFDGGMGTTLYERGVYINRSFDQVNLGDPELVRSVHEEFKAAGAEVLTTNTFSANRAKLKRHGLADQVVDINRRGAEIAGQAAGDEAWVAGCVGPLGVQIEPLGPLALSEAREMFAEQVEALVAGGIDLFICETFIYHSELAEAVRACRQVAPDLPILAELTITDDAGSLTGASPSQVLTDLLSVGADLVGVNCSVGPHVMLEWLETVRENTEVPLSVMPNAGKPRDVEGRNIYLSTPEYLASFTKRFLQAGASVVGGCCGVSPAHLKAMARTFRAESAMSVAKRAPIEAIEAPPEVEPRALYDKSRLGGKLATGRFVTLVELVAPRGTSAKKELEAARRMHVLGVDCINIPDGPRAMARMSALSLAIQIQREVGIEAVLHYACRDRNVIGIQSDLLGAWALGVRNILAITGDPPKLGNYPDATAVFDIDSIGLTNILNRLNHGLDIAANPIGEPAAFCIGVGADPGALNLEEELKRLYWKLEAGAEYIITQPVFDLDVLNRFLEKVARFDVPVIAGLWPLQSLRNAEFMNNEVPGCSVPADVIERLRKCESREAAREEGLAVALETFRRMKSEIQGIQIAAPFGRTEAAQRILDEIL